MRILRAIRHRQIRWLWGGQVFSAMGDEIHSIALVWYATTLLGKNAGYVSALQAGSIFLFSILGGVWADHREHKRVMLFSDILRGLIVLTLPIASYFAPLTLPHVILVVVTASSLSAFFTPALNAFLPQLTHDVPLLQAANGLMGTTNRIARIIGPGLVGLLSRQIPLVHYFTVDALSFFLSAFAISQVKPETAPSLHDQQRLGLKAILLAGFRHVKSHRVLSYTVFSGAFAGAAWLFVLPLGMTLLIQERIPGNIGALGFLISAYGAGNIISNVVISNFHFRSPERWIYSGRLIGAIGILLLSLSSTLEQMMLSSALIAVGGPLTDLGYINLVQSAFTGRDIARVHRFIEAVSQGSLLVAYASSPLLLRIFSVPTVIAFAGVLVFAAGLFGFAFAGSKKA